MLNIASTAAVMFKFENDACDLNQKTLTELKKWQKMAPMGIYGYEFDTFTPKMYQPCWNMLAEEIRLYRNMN